MNTLPLRRIIFSALCLALCAVCTNSYGHKVSSASVVLNIDTEKTRTFQVSVAMQVESSGDPVLDDEIGPEDAARAFVENYLLVLIDEKEQPQSLEVELVNESDADTPVELQQLAVLVNWNGKLPDSGKELALYLKETADMSIVLATVKNGVTARRMQVMFAGEYSRSENIEPLVQGNPFEMQDKAPEKQPEKTPTPTDKVLKPEASEPPSLAGKRFLCGLRASFFALCLPFLFTLAYLMPIETVKKIWLLFVIWTVGLSIGIAASAYQFLPRIDYSIPTACVLLFVLAVENFKGVHFRWSRIPLGIASAVLLGNAVVHHSAFREIGIPPGDTGDLLLFHTGFFLILAIIPFFWSCVLLVLGATKASKNLLILPVSLISAGVAIFHILEIFTAP